MLHEILKIIFPLLMINENCIFDDQIIIADKASLMTDQIQ